MTKKKDDVKFHCYAIINSVTTRVNIPRKLCVRLGQPLASELIFVNIHNVIPLLRNVELILGEKEPLLARCCKLVVVSCSITSVGVSFQQLCSPNTGA